MDKKRRNKMIASYLADWVLTIFLWVSFFVGSAGAIAKQCRSFRQAIFYLLDKINGYRRLFSITDESLAHPYAEHERIPVSLFPRDVRRVHLTLFTTLGLGSRSHRRCLSAPCYPLDGRFLHEKLLRCASGSVGSWLELGFDRHVDGYHQGEQLPRLISKREY